MQQNVTRNYTIFNNKIDQNIYAVPVCGKMHARKDNTILKILLYQLHHGNKPHIKRK